MKNKWLTDLHDRMSDFEMEAPDNLWTDIEKAERQRNSTGKSGSDTFLKRFSAVAAAIILGCIIAGYLFLRPYDNGQVETHLSSHATQETPAMPEEKNSIDTQIRATKKLMSNANMTANNGHSEITEGSSNPSAGKSISDNADEAVISDKQETEEDVQIVDNAADNHSPVSYQSYPMVSPYNKEKPRFSLGIYSSGGISSNTNYKSAESGLVSAGAGNAVWEDSPLLGILLFNKNKEISTKIKHRQPIRAGISLNYKLSDRLGLSSGISYTNLTSDIQSGSEEHFLSGEQSLHYIGIPISASYDVLRWKRLQVYITAGILTEKCVSGKITTDYVISKDSKQRTQENIDKHPLQFSVNTGAGLLLNVFDNMSIYAEPGISYYFKDGAKLRTIYSDKPLNLNLNLGLRFTIGK